VHGRTFALPNDLWGASPPFFVVDTPIYARELPMLLLALTVGLYILILRTLFIALSSWQSRYDESSLSSSNNEWMCRHTGDCADRRTQQQACALTRPVGCYRLHSPAPFCCYSARKLMTTGYNCLLARCHGVIVCLFYASKIFDYIVS